MSIILPNVGDADLKKVWVESFESQPQLYPLWERVFNKVSDDKNAAVMLFTPDIPLLNARGSSVTPIEDTTLSNDYRQTYTHVERARKIRIPYADVSDRPEILSQYASLLGTRTKQTIENLLCSVIANGFSSTVTAKGGTDYVFLDNHTLLGGGTADNALAVSLSHTNFATARAALLFQATDYGSVGTYPARYLVVPKELVEAGYQIQNASAVDSGLQPTSYKGTFEVVPIMFTSSTDDWFLLSEQGMHSFTCVIREAPKFWSHWDEDDMQYIEYAYLRMSQGVIDWRGSIGSTP